MFRSLGVRSFSKINKGVVILPLSRSSAACNKKFLTGTTVYARTVFPVQFSPAGILCRSFSSPKEGLVVTKGLAVSINYTLKDTEGKILDTSQGKDPLSYLHGTGHLIEGLEKEMEGKKAGDKFEVVVPPEQGYGARNEELLKKLPLKMFPDPTEVKVGAMFHQGPHRMWRVLAVEEHEVTVDGNHPLAGTTLHFQVEVVGVRQPTLEESSHGHAHGPGGHAH
eukprot:g56011.t1